MGISSVCDDPKKKRGCRGERGEVIPGITIQSKLKKIKGRDPVGNYPNPDEVNLEGKSGYA